MRDRKKWPRRGSNGAVCRYQVSGFSAAVGQRNVRSNRIKKLCQIGEVSHKRIRRFVLVLVLVLEVFGPPLVSRTRTSTTTRTIQIPYLGII